MSNSYIYQARINDYMEYVRTALHSVNGLVIKASANADAKTTAASICSFKNTFKSLGATATIDLSAAVPTTGTLTIATSSYGVVYVFVASDGATMTSQLVHNSLVVPSFTAGSVCCIGVIKIENATGSDFVVGTTALDVASSTVTYYTPQFLVPGDSLT